MSDLPDEISISWHIDDVKEVAPDLTDEECRQVLQAVERNHDATLGVTWETLEYTAEVLKKDRI